MSLLALGEVVARRGLPVEAAVLDTEGLALMRTFVEPDDQRIKDAEGQLEKARRATSGP